MGIFLGYLNHPLLNELIFLNIAKYIKDTDYVTFINNYNCTFFPSFRTEAYCSHRYIPHLKT